jgi:hypothetical protein
MTGSKLMLISRAGCPVIFFLLSLIFLAGCGGERKSVELGGIDTEETSDQIDTDEAVSFSLTDPTASDSSIADNSDSDPSVSDSLVVPIGTPLHVVLQGEVSTTAFRAGYSFPAFLGKDLVVEGIVIARRGAQVEGKVAESMGGELFGVPRLIMECTGLYFGEQLVPFVTNRAGAEGDPMGGIRHVGDGSVTGKGFGTGKGQQITFPAGTVMIVKIMETLALDKNLLPQQ